MKRCEQCKKPHRPDSFWCSDDCKKKHDDKEEARQKRVTILDQRVKELGL